MYFFSEAHQTNMIIKKSLFSYQESHTGCLKYLFKGPPWGYEGVFEYFIENFHDRRLKTSCNNIQLYLMKFLWSLWSFLLVFYTMKFLTFSHGKTCWGIYVLTNELFFSIFELKCSPLLVEFAVVQLHSEGYKISLILFELYFFCFCIPVIII